MNIPEKLPFEVDDAVVLLLGAGSDIKDLDGKIEGITRLEKLMFLLDKESSLSSVMTEELDFVGYNYGPFSEAIYKAIDSLSQYELVSDSFIKNDTQEDSWESQSIIGGVERDAYTTRDIELTDRGKEYYKSLVNELPAKLVDDVRKLKTSFGALPLRKLIRYVYETYPDYTEKSVIRDQVLGT